MSSGLITNQILLNLIFKEKLELQTFVDTIPIFKCVVLIRVIVSNSSSLAGGGIIHSQPLPCNFLGLPNRTDRIHITQIIGFGFDHVIWIAQ